MANLGPTEIIVILVIVVLLFGAKRLPELGSSVGKSIKNFKSGMKEANEDDDQTPGAATSNASGVKQPENSASGSSAPGGATSRETR